MTGGSGQSYDVVELAAELCREPFNLTTAQILKLDRWTIRNVLLRPRDKDGRLVLRAKPDRSGEVAPRSDREAFDQKWRALGPFAGWQLDRMWAEWRKKLGAAAGPGGR